MGDLIDFLTASKPSFPSGAPVESPGGDNDNVDDDTNTVVLMIDIDIAVDVDFDPDFDVDVDTDAEIFMLMMISIRMLMYLGGKNERRIQASSTCSFPTLSVASCSLISEGK